MDEAVITAAVDRFNEQLSTLPDEIGCPLEGLYPEFDIPDHSPAIYLALVEVEMRQTEDKIRSAEGSEKETLERLCTMLMQCAIALHNAGVQ